MYTTYNITDHLHVYRSIIKNTPCIVLFMTLMHYWIILHFRRNTCTCTFLTSMVLFLELHMYTRFWLLSYPRKFNRENFLSNQSMKLEPSKISGYMAFLILEVYICSSINERLTLHSCCYDCTCTCNMVFCRVEGGRRETYMY